MWRSVLFFLGVADFFLFLITVDPFPAGAETSRFLVVERVVLRPSVKALRVNMTRWGRVMDSFPFCQIINGPSMSDCSDGGELNSLSRFVPDEILEHIFLFLPSVSCILKVSMVCQRWERVSRACRWTTLDLRGLASRKAGISPGPGSAGRMLTPALTTLKVCCDPRSTSKGVYSGMLDSRTPAWVARVLETAAARAPNITTLIIDCFGPLSFDAIDRFPRLEVLDVTDRRGTMFGKTLMRRIIKGCPKLRQFSINFPNGLISPGFQDALILMATSHPTLTAITVDESVPMNLSAFVQGWYATGSPSSTTYVRTPLTD